jgi:hypothetical protein
VRLVAQPPVHSSGLSFYLSFAHGTLRTDRADLMRLPWPLGRLLRLSLFQVSVGMAVALLNGTLNRVMIVELGVAT